MSPRRKVVMERSMAKGYGRSAQVMTEQEVTGGWQRVFGFGVDASVTYTLAGQPGEYGPPQVSWGSLGVVTPDEAREFAMLILTAADTAERFAAELAAGRAS